MKKTQLELIGILGKKIFNTSEVSVSENYGEDELQEIMLEAKQQAVYPLVFDCMKNVLKDKLSAERYIEYETLQYAYIASSLRNKQSHYNIHRLLTDNAIPYVILKGLVSAMYYPELVLRDMGDVDFLVRKSDAARVDELLDQEGYEKKADTENHSFHWEYEKDRRTVEMHWDVPGLPGKDDPGVRKYVSDVMESGRLVQLEDGEFYSPSDFHHGLILLLHTLGHLTSSGIGLRHLFDWLVFENSLSETEFTELFEGPLKEIGLWKFAQVLTKTGIIYCGCAKRGWCENTDPDLCTAFMEDVLAGGNFGRKDKTRINQTKLIRNNTSRKITDGHVVSNIINNFNIKLKKEYPGIYRYKILHPAGWIMISSRYCFYLMLGKRVNLFSRQNYRSAMARQHLYSELKVFEPESAKSQN